MASALVCLEPVGLLDAVAGEGLREEAVAALESGAMVVAIDCRAISLMDSSGFGSLVVCLKKARESSAQFVLIAPTPQMSLVLQMTGTDRIFTIVAEPKDIVLPLQAAKE
ncbi:STAS domain-containing protein [Cyanobium sp. Morenito 9A2]|uniref:STAS domain-containing protein n=1 Tax=Cyanobium sp. Morenito 9A2 TaxID=2823718 RepID=UPI0020CCDC52|nr:STAS domain-containing protein [Cyanobium sp. Morenito 9A2]MCP9849414.1 STAS domain-containing protein [Cyanobium sp. Morenito 9A2]